MKAVTVITGTGIPLRRSDVDTDQIIPAEWLKRVERTGFENGLFSSWRDEQDFVLNDERYAGANVLVAGPAFGVGSSREHAVWAIQQYGFEAVIAPSYSDIFANNCTKNGLVPVVVPEDVVEQIWDAIEADPETTVVVDVDRRRVEVPGAGIDCEFPLDDATRHRFLNGLDDIGLTLAHATDIDTYESSRPAWLGEGEATPLEGEYEPSSWDWVREQVDTYERTGGAEANTLRDTGIPVIIVTCRGVASGRIRKLALMRVEHDGEYALVASVGGAPRNPGWYHNLVAEPRVMIQDGPEPKDYTAEIVDGEERATWWERAVEVFPPYAEYAEKTDRVIPVFVARER